MSKQTKTILFVIIAVVAVFAAFRLFSRRPSAPVGFSLSLPDVYSGAMVVSSGLRRLSIAPLDAQASPAISGEGETFFKDGYSQTDIRQMVRGYSVKEDIVLKEPGHPAQFRFTVAADGLTSRFDAAGNLDFYSRDNQGEIQRDPHPLDKIFTIPAAYLIDAKGEKSSVKEVAMTYENGILTLTPSADWLASHPYPITLDPTVEISVLNLYSHPLTGEDWEVSFTTYGRADLTITPNDAATVADDEFVSLWCGDEERQPQILAGDAIYFKDWECAGIGRVVHNTLKAGDHTLRFEFGDEIAYAYNSFTGDRRYAWGENIGWINASSTYETLTISDAGITGYAWGENIGWIKFDYDGVAGATNTSAYTWGVTNDGSGNLGGYAWGENVGWINFGSTHSQVIIDSDTGDFSGYAWGENIGWINFEHGFSNYVIRYVTSEGNSPVVQTLAVSGIGSQSATVRANVSSDSSITERGFKYGLTETDTWTENDTGDFISIGFEMFLENLEPATTYYVRAYATNSSGTGYGDYVQFTTEATQKGSPIILNEKTILKGKMRLK